MITVEELGRHCDVSRITVLRALNGKENVSPDTRKRILDAAKKLGYRPNAIAQQLKSGKTSTLAVVINNVYTDFLGRLLECVQAEISGIGYESLTYEWSDTDVLADKILSRRVDGVLVLQMDVACQQGFFGEMARFNIPVLLIEQDVDSLGLPCVTSDDKQGVRLAMDHLVAMGHKRIGHIGGKKISVSAKERLHAFYEYAALNGIAVRPEWVVLGDYRYEGALEAVETFFENSKEMPTAIFAGSDTLAATFIQVAHQRGLRVPEDISVVGFCGETFSAMLTPALTTIKQDTGAVAKKSIEVMQDMIEARDEGESNSIPLHTHVPVSFIERCSVKKVQ